MATSRPCLPIVPLCGLLTYQPTSEKHVGGVNVISYLGHFLRYFCLDNGCLVMGESQCSSRRSAGKYRTHPQCASKLGRSFYYNRYFTGLASGIRPCCSTEVYGPTLPTELSGRLKRNPNALGLSGRPCDHDSDAPVQSERP